MTAARHSTGQLLAVVAVLLALAALTAFSLWGMRPASAPRQAAPATTTHTIPAGEREGEGD